MSEKQKLCLATWCLLASADSPAGTGAGSVPDVPDVVILDILPWSPSMTGSWSVEQLWVLVADDGRSESFELQRDVRAAIEEVITYSLLLMNST